MIKRNQGQNLNTHTIAEYKSRNLLVNKKFFSIEIFTFIHIPEISKYI